MDLRKAGKAERPWEQAAGGLSWAEPKEMELALVNLLALAVGTRGTRKQSQAWASASVLSEDQFPQLYIEGSYLDLFI